MAITVFPVEAATLREALLSLPAQQADTIVSHLSKYSGGEQCPLLLNQHCLLYDARPIICRTHGLPIVYTTDGKLSSDFCPRNLTNTASVSGSHTVNIDTLNTLLAAINSLYLTQSESADSADRVTIIAALSAKKSVQ
jgi:Fe-S-cluster containining protein